jgi:DNA repair exonuclease SbcCD ATPase subunit
MRTILALCFIVLLAGAFASKKKTHMQESKLVSALKGLFQVATSDEFDEVAEILAEVRSEIEGLLAKTEANYAAEESDFSDVYSYYTDLLENIADNIVELETEISADEEAADELQDNIDSNLAAIEGAQADQDVEEARRTDYHNAFRAKVDLLNDAVDAAEDALRLLQEIDTQDLSGSFLEINNKKITKNFETIHKNLADLKLRSTVTPITKMLVEIAAAGVNHDLISQLEDLLSQLVDQLNDEVDAAVQDDNNDDEYSRATLATLQNTIDSQSEAAEFNQQNLDAVNEDISNAQDQVEWLSGLWEEGTAELESYEDAWEEKAATYESQIHRLEKDIEAIEAAENFVDRSSSDSSDE